MKILLLSFALVAFGSIAGNPYGDWEERIEPIYQTVPYYGGYYTCTYQQQLYGVNPFGSGITPSNYTIPKTHNRNIYNQKTPRPTLVVLDHYIKLVDPKTGFIFADDNSPYNCYGTQDLPMTHTKEESIGTRSTYYPISPYTSFINVTQRTCSNQIEKDITLHIDTAGGSSMVISEHFNTQPSTLYSGPVSQRVNISLIPGIKRITVKIDSGSTIDRVIQVQGCDSPAVRD